jgi:phosphodiesterase/alkaline phosphatase D-like protein
MHKIILELATMGATGCLLFSSPLFPQVSATTQKAAHVQITHGPELESNRGFLTIIRWTANNPGGSPEHYGIVHYGTDPKNLNQVAKNPIRLNPAHELTVFRVRMDDLKPGTTYYYTVSSTGSDGTDDGTKSLVKKFTTPDEQKRPDQ